MFSIESVKEPFEQPQKCSVCDDVVCVCYNIEHTKITAVVLDDTIQQIVTCNEESLKEKEITLSNIVEQECEILLEKEDEKRIHDMINQLSETIDLVKKPRSIMSFLRNIFLCTNSSYTIVVTEPKLQTEPKLVE